MSLLDTLRCRSTGEPSWLKNEILLFRHLTLICGQTVNTWQDLQNSAAEEQLPPTPSAPLPSVWHCGAFPSQMGPQQDVLLLELDPMGDTGNRLVAEDQFYSFADTFICWGMFCWVTLKPKMFQEHKHQKLRLWWGRAEIREHNENTMRSSMSVSRVEYNEMLHMYAWYM